MNRSNPVLARVMRGNWLENRHRGAFCVTDASGKVLASAGDIDQPIFPRSAIKSIQALALFRSGAAGKFSLDDEQLALACASHSASDVHVSVARRFLDTIGLGIDDLECGAHPPGDREARRALAAKGALPTPIHNNCSGKHSGMLAVARALGVPAKNYVTRDHPVQKLVRTCVETVIGVPLSEDRCGTDGCSIPTWAAPLNTFATGFARMATGEGLPADLADGARRLFDAAARHPVLIGGAGRFDSGALEVFAGRLMVKIGAEGVYCGAVRDLGLGFAIKVDDGNMAAAQSIAAALLLGIAAPDAAATGFLEGWARKPVRNWRNIEVGVIAATALAQPRI